MSIHERFFTRSETIDWQQSLRPGSIRLLAGVPAEELSQPTITTHKAEQVIGLKAEHLDVSAVRKTSHAERQQVRKEELIEAKRKWCKDIAYYLYNRNAIGEDAVKILRNKFDLWIDEKEDLSALQDKPGKVENRIESLANSIEDNLWDRYLAGQEGTGASYVLTFIKDFVKGESFTSAKEKLAKIRPFLGIFGKEATIRQIEDAMIAYAALAKTKPHSTERKALAQHVTTVITHPGGVNPAFVAHYDINTWNQPWVDAPTNLAQPAPERAGEETTDNGDTSLPDDAQPTAEQVEATSQDVLPEAPHAPLSGAFAGPDGPRRAGLI